MEPVDVGHGVVVPADELRIRSARSGGPGGQSVNTTDSAVELRWNVTTSNVLADHQRARLLDRLASRLTADGELILRGREHRSQLENKRAVLARFRALVSEALEPPRTRGRTRPTRASRARRLDAKRRRGETKRLRRPPEP